jgi:hypothetical protein
MRPGQICLGPAFAGASYSFFVTGTTTPANVYENGALTTPYPITGYVTADNFGRFPPIYLDQNVIYKVTFLALNGYTWTRDPYTPTLSTAGTSAKVTSGMQIAATGEVTVTAPASGGTGITATLKAGALGTTPLKISSTLSGQPALIINSSATTGTQTATFAATNKPGTATSSPAGWLPIICDGTVYYIPIWHGNNFTPYTANPGALGETINAQSVVFNGNGSTTATGGTAAPSSWFAPNATNIGNSYYINVTPTSGVGNLSGLAFNISGWNNITGSGITISSNAAAQLIGSYQLSTSVTGTPVVASGTITLVGGPGPTSASYNVATPLNIATAGTTTDGNGNPQANISSSSVAALYMSVTQTGGTSGYSFTGVSTTPSAPTAMSSALAIGITPTPTATVTVSGTYTISTDSGGVNVVATGSITLNGGTDVQSNNYSGTTPLVLASNGSTTLNSVATSSWYSPNVSGIGSSYYINITRTGGTSGVNFTNAQGSWTNIGSGLTIGISGYTGDVGTVTANGTYQISNSSSGSPVFGSGTISLSFSGLTVIHIYTSPVTSATETIPSGTTTVRCEVWGSGGGAGGKTGSGGNLNPGSDGGCGGFAYSSYAASSLGGAGHTIKYTVTAGGAGGAASANGTAGTAGSLTAGTVTGFTTMTANGGGGGLAGGAGGGAGGTATGGNSRNVTGATGSTVGTTGSISGDGGPYGGGGQGGTGAGGNGSGGAAVFFYS